MSKKKNTQTGVPAEPDHGRDAGEWGSPLKVRLLLGTACFFAGAALMVIEITGARLLSPIFGNSLYTWTALIGVVLVAFSVGGYVGGWLADRSPRTRVLGLLLATAGVTTVFIPSVGKLTGDGVAGMGLVAGPVTLSVFLFTVPGVLLGAVSPFTVRLLARHAGDTKIGAAAGLVGMLGSLGSFLGTFASGFYLIPHFGVRQIFLVTSVLLILLAVMIFIGFGVRPGGKASGVLAILAVAGNALFFGTPPGAEENTVFEELTFYHLIRVIDEPAGEGRTMRSLKLDTTTEGGQIVETGELTVEYQHYWKLAQVMGPEMGRALFLGAGAFGMPQHLATRWPDAEVDVVEIDPEVIRAGEECFRLREYENVHAHAADARRFLNTTEERYDYIFADAYNGVRYIPAHLTTKEFFETARERLTDNGVLMMNIISGLTGEQAELFRSIHATLDEVFDHVEVFSTSPMNYVVSHNIILLAGNRDLREFYVAGGAGAGRAGDFGRLAGTRVDPSVYAGEKGVVLTDDRNPVEFIVARQLRERGNNNGMGASYR